MNYTALLSLCEEAEKTKQALACACSPTQQGVAAWVVRARIVQGTMCNCLPAQWMLVNAWDSLHRWFLDVGLNPNYVRSAYDKIAHFDRAGLLG